MESWWVQNLMREAGRLETHGREAVWVQRLSAVRPGREDFVDEVWKLSAGEFSLAQKRSVFCASQAFNWFDEAHPHCGGIMLYSKFTITVNLIQKYPHRNAQNNVWPSMWALWPWQVGTSDLLSHHPCLTSQVKEKQRNEVTCQYGSSSWQNRVPTPRPWPHILANTLLNIRATSAEGPDLSYEAPTRAPGFHRKVDVIAKGLLP